MRYYIAREQNTPPFVVFDKVADSYEELVSKQLEGSPLVVSEDRLLNDNNPEFISYEFGVSGVKIQNGELVTADKTGAQAQFARAVQASKTRKAGEISESATFQFDGREFPMTEGASRYYQAIFSAPPGTPVNIISMNGTYSLAANQVESFRAAYNAKVIALYTAQDLL